MEDERRCPAVLWYCGIGNLVFSLTEECPVDIGGRHPVTLWHYEYRPERRALVTVCGPMEVVLQK